MWDAFESRSHRVQDALDVEDEGEWVDGMYNWDGGLIFWSEELEGDADLWEILNSVQGLFVYMWDAQVSHLFQKSQAGNVNLGRPIAR